MANQSNGDDRHDSTSFMLAEYNRHSGEFKWSEELGEKRVNFFITFVTAVIGALVALGVFLLDEGRSLFLFYILCPISSFFILLFGYVTLVRIVRRNLASHIELRAMGRIRRYFVDRDPPILQYVYYGPRDDSPKRKKNWNDIMSFGSGGLAETVALINSLVAMAFVISAMLALSEVLSVEYIDHIHNVVATVVIAVVSFIIAWTAQFIVVKRRYDRGRPNMKDIKYPKEIEATLIITSENPQDVADKIAELDSIGDYSLLSQPTQDIRDVYFDTQGRDLQTRKFALRIRKVEEKCLLTLKGPSKSINGCTGVERLEIEGEWSKDIWNKVLSNLQDLNVKLDQSALAFGDADPIEIMKNLFLCIVQDRRTHRRVRNVVLKGSKNNSPLAEMAIDDVVYHFPGIDVQLHQIEIETKDEIAYVALDAVVKELLDSFHAEIRTWNYGKLPTGKAIEELLMKFEVDELVNNDGDLRSATYDKLEKHLQKII